MIDSPKIKELVNSFTYEWLRLDRTKVWTLMLKSTKIFGEGALFQETNQFIQYV